MGARKRAGRMNFQGVVMNVADLDRSIDFYPRCSVSVAVPEEQLAAMCAPGSDRAQIIVLRVLGSSPMAGGGHIGLRAFLLDVESAEELEGSQPSWTPGKLFLSRREHRDWTALIGRDPDGAPSS